MTDLMLVRTKRTSVCKTNYSGIDELGYNARNDEIRDNVTRMQRDALGLLVWRRKRKALNSAVSHLRTLVCRPSPIGMLSRFERFATHFSFYFLPFRFEHCTASSN